MTSNENTGNKGSKENKNVGNISTKEELKKIRKQLKETTINEANQHNLTELEYKFFENITSFIANLTKVFEKDKCLTRYAKLIQKCNPFDNKQATRKHISIFRNFVNENKSDIKSKNVNIKKIVYSSEPLDISINLSLFLHKSIDDNKKVIWDYLQVFLYLTNPEEKDGGGINEESVPSSLNDDPNAEFVSSAIGKIQESLTPEQMKDPGMAITGLFASGALNSLITDTNNKVNSGSLNVKSLLGTARKLLDDLEASE